MTDAGASPAPFSHSSMVYMIVNSASDVPERLWRHLQRRKEGNHCCYGERHYGRQFQMTP